MQKYLIQTGTQEYTIRADKLDATINEYAAAEYNILNDDTGQDIGAPYDDKLPLMVFSLIKSI